jgi:hypothetical protein
MKTSDIIILIIGFGYIIFLGSPKISFSPFAFSMENWKLSLAFLFLIGTITFYSLHYKEKGKEEAYDDFIELFKGVRKAETKDSNENEI